MAVQATRKWYDRPATAGAIAIAALVLAGVLTLRALDTGSLGQYFLVFVLLGLALNRALQAMFPRRRQS